MHKTKQKKKIKFNKDEKSKKKKNYRRKKKSGHIKHINNEVKGASKHRCHSIEIS